MKPNIDIHRFLNDASEAYFMLIQQNLNDPETSKDGYMILTPKHANAMLFAALTCALEQQGGKVVAVDLDTGNTINVSDIADQAAAKRQAANNMN